MPPLGQGRSPASLLELEPSLHGPEGAFSDDQLWSGCFSDPAEDRAGVAPPSALGRSPRDQGVGSRTVPPPFFVGSKTIAFATTANIHGSNPEGIVVVVTVRVDGTGLRVVPAPAPSAAGSVVPTFAVTGARPTATAIGLPGPAVNSSQPVPIREVALVDGRRLLQLTNFRRFETGIHPS